jgi:hypothetical protein
VHSRAERFHIGLKVRKEKEEKKKKKTRQTIMN